MNSGAAASSSAIAGAGVDPATRSELDIRLRSAIGALTSALTLTEQDAGSHLVTSVSGLDSPVAINAFAEYALIAGIGSGIRTNLEIATELLGNGPTFEVELRKEVARIIGLDNNITDDFREDQRDPWFTECLAHAMLVVSRTLPHTGPPGAIQAMTLPHTDVHNHGLDLVLLHLEPNGLGLGVSEAKASENHASKHGAATGALFAEVDRGERDPEIRSAVQVLRESLAAEHRSLVTRCFWHERRAYIAAISYSTASSFAPSHRRPTYASLKVSRDRIRLLALPFLNYRPYFDSLADRVRALVPEIAGAGV